MVSSHTCSSLALEAWKETAVVPAVDVAEAWPLGVGTCPWGVLNCCDITRQFCRAVKMGGLVEGAMGEKTKKAGCWWVNADVVCLLLKNWSKSVLLRQVVHAKSIEYIMWR